MAGIVAEIQEELRLHEEADFAEFQKKLIPNIDSDTIHGVRTPQLRAMAKVYGKHEAIGTFLDTLPHETFEENQLHAFILSGMKNYAECIERVEQFLPYVDNWATSDQMSPKIFKKHREELVTVLYRWLENDAVYHKRFAIGMFMEHFLEDDFSMEYVKKIAAIRSQEYYVNMMIAWYMATGLAKQYEAFLPVIEEHWLDVWTHNKAIQKAVESNRITAEQKAYLKMLKIK